MGCGMECSIWVFNDEEFALGSLILREGRKEGRSGRHLAKMKEADIDPTPVRLTPSTLFSSLL